MIDLKSLTFGALAAEREDVTALESYFVESESFRRLRDGQKTVALGNRGSGKSAIFRMIANHERRRGASVIEMAPEDYSYELLSETMAKESEGSWKKHGAYAAAWKYLIYVLAMKKLVEREGGKLVRGPMAKIYNYVRDNQGGVEKNPIGAMISYLKRLEGFKIGSYEASIKTRELQKLYRLEEISGLLDDLDAACSKRSMVILVDELDKGWDASEDAQLFVAGLFHAAAAINQRTPHVRVLVSLRRELYDNIPALYDDAQKFRDTIELIEWAEPQLLELIGRRIGRSLADTEFSGYSERWNAVFAETLDYRRTRSFNYLIDRTLYRPRELIGFCSTIREKALDMGSVPPVNYKVISEAEQSYSEARLKDIAAEYRFQYPGLTSVFETFRGKPYTMNRSVLEEHCLRIATNEHRVSEDAGTWCADRNPEDLIDIFWRIGFLRARAVGGLRARRRRGSSYLGPHQISAMNLRNVTSFHVHPMFRSFLGMKESKGGVDDEDDDDTTE